MTTLTKAIAGSSDDGYRRIICALQHKSRNAQNRRVRGTGCGLLLGPVHRVGGGAAHHLAEVLALLGQAGHLPRDAAKRVDAALERVGLAGRGREMPPGLSGGEQQRVAIARAIVNRPSILIADEPTAHLDSAYARDIAGLFKSFNEAGVTIIVSTHDERLFSQWRPRRMVLGKGLLMRDFAA